MTGRSIIVLEANEVPFKVFDYFCRRRPGSALARIMDRSAQYRTHTEDKTRFIMPWTTWPSFHRGVHDEMHQIYKFGQWETETDRRYPPIWSILARNGIRTGVFSSMQSSPLPPNSRDFAFYFPDMFGNDAATHPNELRALQEFNLAMTRSSARNVSRRIDLRRAAKMLATSGKLGIRASTYAGIGGQLVSELLNSHRKTRRRAYQPLLLLDAFRRQVERTRPQFATFFTNHVAAAMHRYWAAVFPEDYTEFQLDPAWVDKYRHEIEFAMAKLDTMVDGLARFVDAHPQYMLVVATSMGQAAIPASHVKKFLTITDLQAFMGAFHLSAAEFEERPAMVPDFSFKLAPAKADEFDRALRSLSIGGKSAGIHRDHDFFHVSVYDERQNLEQAELLGRTVTLAEIGLGYHIHEDEVACTAQHIPEGVLLVYSPHSDANPSAERIDTSALDFAPSVLRNFGLERPSYMKHADLLAAR
jgi:hypothetical protein